MASQETPFSGRSTGAADILRNSALLGAELTSDVEVRGRLGAPNESVQRSQKWQEEGLVKVVVRLGAEDLGALMLAGAKERQESVLSKQELGALVIRNILGYADDIKAGVEAQPGGENANLTIKLRHPGYPPEHTDNPEFWLFTDFSPGYVEIGWSAHSPATNLSEHQVPIGIANSLIAFVRNEGYERHWRAAIAHYHPDWGPDTELAIKGPEGEGISFETATTGLPIVHDIPNLKNALAAELKTALRNFPSGLRSYDEQPSVLRLRIPVRPEAAHQRSNLEVTAADMDRELRNLALDGTHSVRPFIGETPDVPTHIIIEYNYATGMESDGRDIERRQAYSAIFQLVRENCTLFRQPARKA